ncbi:MAG: trypsin-like peptidase domain-containing protein, partial [Alistipes sp.]|nr:trypsin-like peptidase domain-containing protein [Candidatus Minthomonas equi]
MASLISGALAAVAVTEFIGGRQSSSTSSYVYSDDSARVQQVNFSGEYPDFTYAAESAVKAVVFVKVIVRSEQPQMPNNFFEYFFGYGGGSGQPREQVGSGSGVIIREDGYIVTNNHVVNGASEIEVTMDDGKSFKADLIGTDPVTDIALIKIDGQNLPTVPIGDSDKLRIGEWVLAIGSPYGLTSTITAGIVSAKGRSLADNREFKIESFIQTDAAVNPGNSGGALVNIKGELVGINTAIYSNTGSYAGCAFAVPVRMAQKVVEDLLDYGSVQRGLLGISMLNNSEQLSTEKKLSTSEGVYIAEVVKGGAAAAAGVKEGDVLMAI